MICYTELMTARDGSIIPAINGRPLHSSYNPLREAEQFASSCAESSFFVILGIAGAYHIHALKERFPDSIIIAAETNEETLQFILNIPCVKLCSDNPDIHFTTIENLSETILKTFLPIRHKTFTVCTLRPWENAFSQECTRAKELIQDAIQCVSADFSVQSHFGGIWQRNFFANLSLFDGPYASKLNRPLSFNTKKTAAIIAAGPSLDQTITDLKRNRNDYIIFATDTALGALEKHQICADAVVSVDAQMVSHNHFFRVQPETLCIFDLCASAASVRHCLESGNSVYFISSAHPLTSLAASFGSQIFPAVTSGGGTVTVAAVDFAMHSGFSRIRLFGADFSYRNGKAYTKGTYLDDLYNKDSTRLKSAELKFDALCFRTELTKKADGIFTTEVLERYRKSLEDFFLQNGWKNTSDSVFEKDSSSASFADDSRADKAAFDYHAFISHYKSLKETNPELYEKSLLPYASWLMNRARYLKESENQDFLSLAHSQTLVYTKIS